MPKIISAFSSPNPIGKTLSDLGSQLFANSSKNALEGEKLYAAQRENTETDNLMRMVANSGAGDLGNNPVAQALMIGSGYAPGDFGKIGLMDAATRFGAKAPQTQNWQVGSGQSYGNTAGAFDATLAETRRNNNMASSDRRYNTDRSVNESARQFNMTPVEALVNGLATFVPRSESFGEGISPILSDAERKGTLAGLNFGSMGDLPAEEQAYLGADPSASKPTPKNYITKNGTFITYDGVTDARTGQPLEPGGYVGTVQGGAEDVGLTNSVTTGVQGQIIGADRFNVLADKMEDYAANNPASFGAVGKIRGWAQEGVEGLRAIGMATGQNVEGELANARRDAAEKGLSSLIPEIYDTSIPGVQMVGGLMLYQGASALAGQEGRDISDKDVQFFRQILGDPLSWTASAKQMAVKTQLAKDIINEHKRLSQSYLDRGIQPPDNLAEQAYANTLGSPGAEPAPAVNGGVIQPPPQAIEDLRANPNTAAQFDEIFGQGAAARVLGGG